MGGWERGRMEGAHKAGNDEGKEERRYTREKENIYFHTNTSIQSSKHKAAKLSKTKTL